MYNILEKWNNYSLFTEKEYEFINTTNPTEKIIDPKKYIEFENEYFNLLPFSNISSETYNVRLADCATTLIKQLFSHYVNDNTLIICSDLEHANVKEIISHYKQNNIYYINYQNIQTNFLLLLDKIKDYQNIFVYCIGTTISNGIIAPQHVFQKLKGYFIENNKQYKMVLDDIQGMFLVPRDYSVFDYIINTGHSLITNYNAGMVIYKKELWCPGEEIYNWGEGYIERVKLLLTKFNKINIFNLVCKQYFEYLLKDNRFSFPNNTCNHIFSIQTRDLKFNKSMRDLMDKYYIKLEGAEKENNKNIFIRFRAQQFILNHNVLLSGVKKLEQLIKIVK